MMSTSPERGHLLPSPRVQNAGQLRLPPCPSAFSPPKLGRKPQHCALPAEQAAGSHLLLFALSLDPFPVPVTPGFYLTRVAKFVHVHVAGLLRLVHRADDHLRAQKAVDVAHLERRSQPMKATPSELN